MRKTFLCISALIHLAWANAAENATTLVERGNPQAGEIAVDNAPGAVSAMAMLGIGPDQTTVVQNPRNLTVALKALDGKNALGLSITPARTALAPLSVEAYNSSFPARLWGATTLSYAQGRVEAEGKEFDRRAFAVETSFYFDAGEDPLIRYWRALAHAKNGPCLMPASPPPQAAPPSDNDGPTVMRDVGPEEKAASDKSAEACRDSVTKTARWNPSHAWISWASGSYQAAAGGDSFSLGQTAVVGITWGIGGALPEASKDVQNSTGTAITLATKRSSNSPVLKTMGSASPTRKDTRLTVVRIAVGTSAIRALFEGSDTRDDEPTAASRTYKRALGIEARLAEGIWLQFKAGKQRKVDNTGDENASSVSLSYSPKQLLTL